jgi:hypothetical protein
MVHMFALSHPRVCIFHVHNITSEWRENKTTSLDHVVVDDDDGENDGWANSNRKQRELCISLLIMKKQPSIYCNLRLQWAQIYIAAVAALVYLIPQQMKMEDEMNNEENFIFVVASKKTTHVY